MQLRLCRWMMYNKNTNIRRNKKYSDWRWDLRLHKRSLRFFKLAASVRASSTVKMSQKLSERLAQFVKVQQTIEKNIDLLLKSTRLPFYSPDYSRLGHSYVELGRTSAFDNKEREPFASSTYSTLLVLYWSSEWLRDRETIAKRTMIRQLFQTVHSTMHMTLTAYTQHIALKIPKDRREDAQELLDGIVNCICLLFQLSSIITCSTEFAQLSPQWNAWVEDPNSPTASLCDLIHDMLDVLAYFINKASYLHSLASASIHSDVKTFLVHVHEYVAIAIRNTWSATAASSTLSSANSLHDSDHDDSQASAQFNEDQEQSPPEARPGHRNIAVDINRAQKLFVAAFMSPFTNYLNIAFQLLDATKQKAITLRPVIPPLVSQGVYGKFKLGNSPTTKSKRPVAAAPSKLRPTAVYSTATAARPSSYSSSSLSATPYAGEPSFDESDSSFQPAEETTGEYYNSASPVRYQQYSHPPIPTTRVQHPHTPYENEHDDDEYSSPVTFPAISPQTPTTTRYLQGPQTPVDESFTEGFFYSDFGATPLPAPETPLALSSDDAAVFDL